MNSIETDGKAIFSPGQKVRGLLAACIVGWLLVTTIDLGWPLLEASFANEFLGKDVYVPPLSQVLQWVVLYIFIGLPVAAVACFVVGYPMWKAAEARGRKSLADGAKVGALVALLIGTVGIALNLVSGLQTALDENLNYNAFRWGYQVVRDGLPTLLGLALKFVGLASTVIVGIFAGMVARLAAGQPRSY